MIRQKRKQDCIAKNFHTTSRPSNSKRASSPYDRRLLPSLTSRRMQDRPLYSQLKQLFCSRCLVPRARPPTRACCPVAGALHRPFASGVADYPPAGCLHAILHRLGRRRHHRLHAMGAIMTGCGNISSTGYGCGRYTGAIGLPTGATGSSSACTGR